MKRADFQQRQALVQPFFHVEEHRQRTRHRSHYEVCHGEVGHQEVEGISQVLVGIDGHGQDHEEVAGDV